MVIGPCVVVAGPSPLPMEGGDGCRRETVGCLPVPSLTLSTSKFKQNIRMRKAGLFPGVVERGDIPLVLLVGALGCRAGPMRHGKMALCFS